MNIVGGSVVLLPVCSAVAERLLWEQGMQVRFLLDGQIRWML